MSPSQTTRSGSWAQGQLDGRLERLLEVPLALIDPALGGEGVVGATQVGVADGCNPHTAPANQRPV